MTPNITNYRTLRRSNDPVWPYKATVSLYPLKANWRSRSLRWSETTVENRVRPRFCGTSSEPRSNGHRRLWRDRLAQANICRRPVPGHKSPWPTLTNIRHHRRRPVNSVEFLVQRAFGMARGIHVACIGRPECLLSSDRVRENIRVDENHVAAAPRPRDSFTTRRCSSQSGSLSGPSRAAHSLKNSKTSSGDSNG